MKPEIFAQLPAEICSTPLGEWLAAIRQAQRMTMGVSAAQVFRLCDDHDEVTFLKINPHHSNLNLAEDAARLRWLIAYLPVPEVLSFHEDETHSYLLMSAIPGRDCATLAVEAAMPTVEIVRLLAGALKRFHAVPITHCPFDHRLQAELVRIRRSIEQKPQGEQQQAFAELEQLSASLPASEDLVLTHGDACLPNIMLEPGRVSGFIDLGLAGIGDRYRDLALTQRSLIRNCGAEWVPLFFETYGLPQPDEEKLLFYQRLEDLW